VLIKFKEVLEQYFDKNLIVIVQQDEDHSIVFGLDMIVNSAILAYFQMTRKHLLNEMMSELTVNVYKALI
jgi:hypothetical protein